MVSKIHSFAVGLVGSPDLAAAQKAAEHIGSVHHEVNFTVQEGLDAVRDVIYHLETYDVTTIRASTPCIFWQELSNLWESKWFFPEKVLMNYSVDIYISTKLRMQRIP
jgi:asparagine synthetase B (glutamine-hydrolysing)